MFPQAKILNFSIAYGKTAHGLAKDFNTSLKEAEETVNKWVTSSDRGLRGMNHGVKGMKGGSKGMKGGAG